MKPEKQSLENNLSVFTLNVPGYTLSSFIAFPAGSRYETEKENGIAHALEHMVFKGGEKWSTYDQVNKAADSLGASMNAFTSQEMVAFYIKSRAEDGKEALDLLTDFVAKPQLRKEELEKEKEVIVQEIAMYDDRPSHRADELIEKATYKTNSMGRPITGTPETVRSFSIKDLQAFRKKTWSNSKGAMVIVGDIEKAGGKEGLTAYGQKFAVNKSNPVYEKVESVSSGVLVEQEETSQSHLRMYYETDIDWANGIQRTSFSLLSCLLGGSMSSVLFDEIREKRGLCYNIGSYASMLPDHQGLSISAGLQTEQTKEAFELIRTIVEKDLEKYITEEAFQRSRRFLLGSVAMGRESTNNVAHKLANAHISGLPMDLDQAFVNINNLTRNNVLTIAKQLSENSSLAVACVGNHKAEDFS